MFALLFTVMAVLVFLLVFIATSKKDVSEPIVEKVQKTVPDNVEETETQSSEPMGSNTPSKDLQSETEEEDSDLEEKLFAAVEGLTREERLDAMTAGSNRSVDFHGLVIDQYGEPVPGVRIIYYITQETPGGWRPAGAETRTDVSGRFNIVGSAEHFYTRKMLKEGYKFEKGGGARFATRRRDVGEAHPRQYPYDDPYVFKAWKEGEPAGVIRDSARATLLPDERIYTIDLLANQANVAFEGKGTGDFTVRLYRDESVFDETKGGAKTITLGAIP